MDQISMLWIELLSSWYSFLFLWQWTILLDWTVLFASPLMLALQFNYQAQTFMSALSWMVAFLAQWFTIWFFAVVALFTAWSVALLAQWFTVWFFAVVALFTAWSDALAAWSDALTAWSDALTAWSDALTAWSDALAAWSDALAAWSFFFVFFGGFLLTVWLLAFLFVTGLFWEPFVFSHISVAPLLCPFSANLMTKHSVASVSINFSPLSDVILFASVTIFTMLFGCLLLWTVRFFGFSWVSWVSWVISSVLVSVSLSPPSGFLVFAWFTFCWIFHWSFIRAIFWYYFTRFMYRSLSWSDSSRLIVR